MERSGWNIETTVERRIKRKNPWKCLGNLVLDTIWRIAWKSGCLETTLQIIGERKLQLFALFAFTQNFTAFWLHICLVLKTLTQQLNNAGNTSNVGPAHFQERYLGQNLYPHHLGWYCNLYKKKIKSKTKCSKRFSVFFLSKKIPGRWSFYSVLNFTHLN